MKTWTEDAAALFLPGNLGITLTLCSMYACWAAGTYSLNIWRPLFLKRTLGHDEVPFRDLFYIELGVMISLIGVSLVIDYYGRRRIARYGFFFCACCCFTAAVWGRRLQVLEPPMPTVAIVGSRNDMTLLLMVGGATCLSAIIWPAVVNTFLEAYPTVCRGTAYGLGKISVRISAFLVPTFLVPPVSAGASGGVWTFLTITFIFMLGCVAALYLPVETANKKMLDFNMTPQELAENQKEEAEHLEPKWHVSSPRTDTDAPSKN